MGLFAAGLMHDPREVPSALIGQPAPVFELTDLHHPEQRHTPALYRGQVLLLNAWASWCVACRAEHPLLLELAQAHAVPIYGLNYKDTRADALAWLAEFGDPYIKSLQDPQGRAGFDYGVYGVPETFVIDRRGVIRHKVIGPMTREKWQREVLPLLQRLRGESA